MQMLPDDRDSIEFECSRQSKQETMRVENSKRTEDVLRASAEYVSALRKIAEEHEILSDENDPEVLEYISALHLCWLLAKFNNFWFTSAETEMYIRETWPDIECFSAVDF